jgi:phosphatidylserine/phosphatidylglycerophosphate/cardiolipin synthase-like enzyme
LAIRRFVPAAAADATATQLDSWAAHGLGASALADLLALIASERSSQRQVADRVELVWSGPETEASVSRETAVVVRELFASARHSVLVSGYAVYQGKRVFHELAVNLDARPDLQVRMFLNVQREPRDARSNEELTREFAERFRKNEWPGVRLPSVYFDPRSLQDGPGVRACLHAKCIVVDDERAFVTSANFTEAAQQRNLEAGVLVESAIFARALRTQFESLVTSRSLVRLAGLG